MVDRELNQKGVEELEDIVRRAVADRDEGTLVEVQKVLARRSVSRSVELRRIVRGILALWQRGSSGRRSSRTEDASDGESHPPSKRRGQRTIDLDAADESGDHRAPVEPEDGVESRDHGAAAPGEGRPPDRAPVDTDQLDLDWLHARTEAREGEIRFRFNERQVRDFLANVGASDSEAWFRLRQRAERLALLPGFQELIALDANTIEELAHQTETAMRVLQDMNGRGILADEVGLGKTIEAGLIIKELLVRRLARTILVLCPAALIHQWQEEMREKFFIDFEVIEDAHQWRTADYAISSLARARHPANKPRVTRRKWDIVVVDEAHKAKNHRTATYRTIQEIERDFILLLTATPLQNSLREFYNLVTLVRPGQFGTWSEFRERHVTRGDVRKPKDVGAIRDIASDVMVRNKRSNVNLQLPRRIPHRPTFELTPAEKSIYDDTAAFLRELYRRGMYPDAQKKGQHFVLTRMAQRVCSSSAAIAASLRRMGGNQDVRPEFRQRATELARRAGAVRTHAKLRALDAVFATHPEKRVVVFSEHRPTIELIKKHLEARGKEVFPYHGGISRRRRVRLKRRFRDTPGSVFLSSRSGTEGLNLQFAHVLVNYELPWNPLLVEQRIGRLHRIGQEREVVIYNLAARGTVEDRILEVLQEKIRLFELVVGELDLILGRFDDASELENRFSTAWLAASDEEAFERKVEEISEEVSKSYEEGKAAEEMSSYIAPADNADRLTEEFAALSIPARVRLAWGTPHINFAGGVEGDRKRIGLTVHEIQAALRLAGRPEDSGMSDYGPTVWVRSATARGRAVSLRVAADTLPITILEVRADEEAPLAAESHRE